MRGGEGSGVLGEGTGPECGELGGVVVCSWDSDAEVAGSILGVGFSAKPDHNNP